jgi:hypothetical protein
VGVVRGPQDAGDARAEGGPRAAAGALRDDGRLDRRDGIGVAGAVAAHGPRAGRAAEKQPHRQQRTEDLPHDETSWERAARV